MSHRGKRNRTARDPIAIMEGLLDDVAEQAVEDLEPTEDSIQWSRELGDQVRREILRQNAKVQYAHRHLSR
jgi:hypothetical protein